MTIKIADDLTITAAAQAITDACVLLFGETTTVSPEFMGYLQMSGLKAAYRNMAMRNHPDLSLQIGVETAVLQQRFNTIRQAYELLLPYVTGEKKIPHWYNDQIAMRIRTPQPIPALRRNTHRRYHHYRADANGKHTFHRGAVPQKNLRFAEYLYYHRHISWENMFAALIWQRLNRPRLGEIALEKGWLRADEMLEIRRQKQGNEMLGETAVRVGLLEPNQLRLLLGTQKLYSCPIGRYFIEQAIITAADLAQLLVAHRQHSFFVGREKLKARPLRACG